MKRMRRPPPTAWSKFRPFLLPAIAVMVFVMMALDSGFDVKTMREHFERGHVDAALATLTSAPQEDLPPSLRGVTFYDAGRRAAKLQVLAQKTADELLESLDFPTIISPIDTQASAPTEIVLREPATEALVAELRHTSLNMLAEKVDVPMGTQRWPISTTLIPGGQYTVFLSRASDMSEERQYVSIVAFDLVSPHETEPMDTALATARELAGGGNGGTLLAAQIAMFAGHYERAATILEKLEQLPAYVRAARELRAIALNEMGLDITARKLAGTTGR